MTKPVRIAAWIAAGAASLLMLGALNAAAGDYPDHPIRLLVPAAAWTPSRGWWPTPSAKP
jgi:hypothetical protein